MPLTVELSPLVPHNGRLQGTVVAIAVATMVLEVVLAVALRATGGAGLALWTGGFTALLAVLVLLAVRGQRLELDGGTAVIVDRLGVGRQRRVTLGPGTRVRVCPSASHLVVRISRGWRRARVQVLAYPSVWAVDAPPVARDPAELRALAQAVRTCDGGPEVADALDAHLDSMAHGVSVEASPLWG